MKPIEVIVSASPTVSTNCSAVTEKVRARMLKVPEIPLLSPVLSVTVAEKLLPGKRVAEVEEMVTVPPHGSVATARVAVKFNVSPVKSSTPSMLALLCVVSLRSVKLVPAAGSFDTM